MVKGPRYTWVDPLILDLDGDGLEISPLSRNIQFDTDGDGIKTGTAWANADDGILAWDRNGNGLIDSGRELFGDETLLANGQKATHGFTALGELDVGGAQGTVGGAGDGVFDAKDAQYANLRVWRDLNQDGISQTGELQTLAEAGIASIGLSSTATSTDYGDAQLVQSGSFIRSNGSEGQAGSFILAQNNFVTTHTPITVSDAARALADIKGTGWARDLQQAATLSPELLGLYEQAASSGSRAGFSNGVGQLLRAWSNQSDYASASKQALEEGVGLILRNPADAQERGWMSMAIKADKATRDGFRATLSAQDRSKFDSMRESMVGSLEKLYAYEAFTGFTFLHWSQIKQQGQGSWVAPENRGRLVTVDMPLSHAIRDNRVALPASDAGYIVVTVPEPVGGGTPHIQKLWNRLLDDASNNLMPAMRLSKYLDMVQVNVLDSGAEVDFSRMDTALSAVRATDAYEGAALFLDLYRVHGKTLNSAGWTGKEQLRALMQTAADNGSVRDAFAATGYNYLAASSPTGSMGDDSYAGNAHANTFHGGVGNDFIDGMAGNDRLEGGVGNDALFGGEGDDYLSGGDGADTLDGGAGNDTLHGDYGNDTYLFGKGDGQDTISSASDSAADKLNVLQFKAGVAPSEIVATRSGSNLVLSIVGTTDKVSISDFFYSDNPANAWNPVQQIRFANGTTWDINGIKSQVFAGTATADNIVGTTADDAISGQAGADTIDGRDGNDTLDGGADNDTLSGGNGADTLDGGAGNDTLHGGYGNDTYLFGKGDGQDTISSASDSAADKLNVLQFKAGVAPSEIVATRSGSNLVLSIVGTTDKVSISDFFYSDNPANAWNPVQQIRFANGTTWDINGIKSQVFAGTAAADNIVGTTADDAISGQAGADTIDGRDGNDTLDGGADNDTLSGGNGADTLDGGAGNDTLHGGYGNDTYLFGKGDGQDTISSASDSAADKLNVLQFKAGVAPSEIVATRSGSNLVLSIVGTTDKVSISDFFYSDNPANAWNPVQQIRFANGTTWDINGIKSQVFAGTAAADNIVGTTADDTITGQAGADTIYGRDGNDTLDGGAGNDTLHGGYGNDTYLFGKGDGQDTISSASDSAADKLNVLQFKAGVAPSEIVATRSGSNLVLSIVGTSDKVSISDFFYSDNPANAWNPVQQIRFANGTTWDINGIKSQVFAGTAAADNIVGTTANDAISGQAGADTIDGRDGNDTLDGGADNDILYGGNGADTLDGGAGNDTLHGGYGNDTYLFGKGDGQDTINSASDSAADKLNVLQFKAGVAPSEIVATRSGSNLVLSIVGTTDKVSISDFFYSDNPANAWNPVQQIRFANGTTWDINGIKSQVFAGTVAADNIVGTTADDTISGQAGADTIDGRDGNDTLDGGAGNDTLHGGYGNDTYLFGKGDGQDTISSASDSAADKLNVLQFKAGVAPSEIMATRSGSNLVLSIVGTTDKVSISDFFYSDNPANAWNPVQQIRFANGTTWDINGIKSQVFAGTATADNIVGTTADDAISGQAGADTIDGRDGNDTLDGGADNDTLSGGNGADTLDGGAGNDTLHGGYGNDTYLFGKGDGQDTISSASDSAADKLNVLQFKAGVAPSEIVATRSGSNLVLSIVGTSDKVSISDFFYSDNPANAWNPVQQIRFANGTTWDINGIKSQVFAGTAAADNIVGTTANDAISGQAGADTIDGRDGNDTLDGGADNDILYGGNGADTLDGGAGNDTLHGGYGNDTYLFGKGDGQDTINSASDSAADKLNVLQFKAGVAPSEIVATRSGSNLVLSIAGTTDKVSISDFFYNDDPTNNWNPIQQVRFANGTTWDINGIKSKVFAGTAAADNIVGTTADDAISGQAGADTIYGRDGNDRLYGGADNDTLYGENGADTLDGGAGNDTLNGGHGNDTYVFGRGSGADSITDYDSTAGNTDCLSIGAGVSTNQLWLRRVGTDLEVSIIGTSDKSLINNWYAGNAYHIERFQTSNGNVLLDSQVNALVSAMAGFAPPPAGQTTLAADYQTALAPVLAAGWN
ncbi:beta strand repeat-containing protein [Verminephrobacter aporrectodeae]|uniref:beta strand repeat-containing protein n=1 Tax=Verminephrobacter aporrectodeae TaxID=1110389 RepID=UPI002AA2B166|nr:calcium-binding protein [Verminephrobacter aporrectodeae]